MQFLAMWGKTLGEALGFRRYIIVSTATGITTILAGLYAYLSGLPHVTWLPQMPWLALLIIVLLAIILFTLLPYANALRIERAPKIAILSIGIHDADHQHYISVRIHNKSSMKAEGVKARIERIFDSIGVLARGQILDEKARGRHLDYPIKLFPQERLKERLANGDPLVRPFDLAPNEKKWIEVFQVVHTDNKHLQVYDVDKKHDLITPEDATFECTVHGAGLPVTFFVEYADDANDRVSYSVSVSDHAKRLIDKRTYSRESTNVSR
jgi:hypothetical protein